jgi:hypothetical protein
MTKHSVLSSKTPDLQRVFEEAMVDGYAANASSTTYEARLVYGIKIVRDNKSGDVSILNTLRNGDHYEDITVEYREVFATRPWRKAVREVVLNDCKVKLDEVELRIKEEVNGRNNDRHLLRLKASRQRILARYTKIKKNN